MNALDPLTAAIRVPPPALHVRWGMRRDMAAVQAIEDASFVTPWTDDDFTDVMRRRNCIAYVAVRADIVVGYVVYELRTASLEILNLAVRPDCRRQGVGAKLVDKVVSKIYSGRRTRVEVAVREGNLPAQLFFKGHGFRATSVSRGHFDDTGEDAYLMSYSL